MRIFCGKMEIFCTRRLHIPSASSLKTKTMAVFTAEACLFNGSTSVTARGGHVFDINTQKTGIFSTVLED